jgi:hypothetical protein
MTDRAYLEARLIKVVHVIVVDAVLGFSVLYQLEPRADSLWIFLQYPLPIVDLIKGYPEFSLTCHEAFSLMFAN